MKLKIWGTRGSISVPGQDTVRYGGNTSCYQIISNSGDQLIFDAGTGIRELGKTLIPKMPLQAHILFSHTHYDHVIGYPFFVPLFVPGNEVNLYGPVHYDRSFKSVMTEQLDYSFFPVRMDELLATLNFHDLKEQSFEIGPFKIQTMYSNHPVTSLAYRVEVDRKTFVYTGDTEPYINHLEGDEDADEDELEEIEDLITEQNERWIGFLDSADLIVYDSQYTPEEYPKFKGWGHTSMDVAIENGQKAGAKKLLMTHHDPNRVDDELDQLGERWKAYVKDKKYPLQVEFAVEGQSYEI